MPLAAVCRLLAASAIFWLPVVGSGHAGERLDIRASSLLPREIQEALAEVALPTTRILAPGTQPEDAARHHCGGSVTSHYLSQFAAANKSGGPVPLLVLATPRQMVFPPCLKVKARAEVALISGDSLAPVLVREMGVMPDTLLTVCRADGNASVCTAVTGRKAVADEMRWPESALDDLSRYKSLVLPFASRMTTVTLKDDISVEAATAKLRAASASLPGGRDLLRISPTPELALPTPLTADDDPACRQTGKASADWPFDQQATRDALTAATKYINGNRGMGGAYQPTVIRIADTGVLDPGQETGFPERFLAVNVKETHRSTVDNDNRGNGFVGDRYGIDADGGGAVEPLRDQTEWLHGSQVAQLALGGSAFWASLDPKELPVRLNFARIWKRVDTNRIDPSSAAITESFTAHPKLAHVINLSVGGSKETQAIKSALMQLSSNRQIAVIAAGNDGKPLGRNPVYPAGYGGAPNLKTSVIVVGAHDSEGRITQTSNYDQNSVHLLAPGCGIPNPYNTQDTPYLTGTSFAAPLVSFTVAAVRAFLSAASQDSTAVDSAEVIARLRIATRYVGEDVAEKTQFGGVLDIPATLRVFDDVVRLPNGQLVVGRWLEPRILHLCADYSLRPKNILRIRVQPTPEGSSPHLHILSLNAGKYVPDQEDKPCKALSDEGVLSILLEDGQIRTFRWREIAAFIPAYDLENRRISPKLPEMPPAGVEAMAARLPLASLLPQAVNGLEPATKFARQNERMVTSPAILPDQREATRAIQEALIRHSLDPGNPDGVIGAKTLNAIRRFQSDRLEQPSGILTERQRQALLSPPDVEPPLK